MSCYVYRVHATKTFLTGNLKGMSVEWIVSYCTHDSAIECVADLIKTPRGRDISTGSLYTMSDAWIEAL